MSTQCAALVYKRDTYRVARGTKSGFRMHYNKCQCQRAAVEKDLCRQHWKIEKTGMCVIRWPWLPTTPNPPGKSSDKI